MIDRAGSVHLSGGYPYRLWLLYAGYPAMCLGMLAYMLYRRHRFAGRAGSLRALARPEGQA